MTDPGRKNVLILTYYWPPGGGAGVQRWLKFTKYLREFKWEPVIYTAEDPEYPSIDESLFKDIPENIKILKTKVREPYKLYKWFTSQKKDHRINTGFLSKEKKKGFAEKISVWIRGNMFIPDARKFWIKPSVRYLARYLIDHPVDLIVSTGPPHSLHLIALKVSEKMDLPWVADFRDPWTKIDYYQDLMLNRRADRKHHKLERKVLQSASAVTVISKDMERQFQAIGSPNIRVIPNGFDPDDFITAAASAGHDGIDQPGGLDKTDNLLVSGTELDREFSLTHIGTIVPSRNPSTLWKVLSELVQENDDIARDLKIKLIGASDYSVLKSIEETGLGRWVSSTDYLPHQEAISMLKSSQVLLLLINNTANAKGILTGKFFEYMSSGRPILAIGPVDGEAGHILKETRTGEIVDFEDHETLKKQIRDYYGKYKKGRLNVAPEKIGKYSRKSLTGSMAGLFNELLETT